MSWRRVVVAPRSAATRWRRKLGWGFLFQFTHCPRPLALSAAGRLGNFRRPASFLNPENQQHEVKSKMIPAKKPAPVRMGVVAETATIADRLTRLEAKADYLITMMEPMSTLFAHKSMRIAIGAAITSSSMQFPRR
jgi:hypothetical protein